MSIRHRVRGVNRLRGGNFTRVEGRAHGGAGRDLVAQAQLEGLPILTSDPWIRRYDVEVMEAD
jgi:hypothetical protein